jgi:glycosyltransferase involved in cell wall biosynthesis
MTAQMFDLTIIVPNYNTKDLLHNCIASICEHTNWISFEIICIDDSSSEGSAEMVAKSFPDVILRRGDSPPLPRLDVRPWNLRICRMGQKSEDPKR